MRIWSTEMLFENFQIFHNILLNFVKFRGGQFRKACTSHKKQSKSSDTYKQSELARIFLKIEKRKKF